MSNLKGKVAVVTGASKGIGAAIARALGGAGASVVVNYASDKAGADKVVAEIAKAGGKAVAVQADLSKPADIASAVRRGPKAFGRLDVLVNNAGVFKFSPLAEVEPANFTASSTPMCWDRSWRRAKRRAISATAGGSIINISSVVSEAAYPGSVIYSATKGALDAVTRVLAAELGAPQNPRQHSGARHDRNRRHPCRRIHRQRFPEGRGSLHAAGPHRPAG